MEDYPDLAATSTSRAASGRSSKQHVYSSSSSFLMQAHAAKRFHSESGVSLGGQLSGGSVYAGAASAVSRAGAGGKSATRGSRKDGDDLFARAELAFLIQTLPTNSTTATRMIVDSSTSPCPSSTFFAPLPSLCNNIPQHQHQQLQQEEEEQERQIKIQGLGLPFHTTTALEDTTQKTYLLSSTPLSSPPSSPPFRPSSSSAAVLRRLGRSSSLTCLPLNPSSSLPSPPPLASPPLPTINFPSLSLSQSSRSSTDSSNSSGTPTHTATTASFPPPSSLCSSLSIFSRSLSNSSSSSSFSTTTTTSSSSSSSPSPFNGSLPPVLDNDPEKAEEEEEGREERGRRDLLDSVTLSAARQTSLKATSSSSSSSSTSSWTSRGASEGEEEEEEEEEGQIKILGLPSPPNNLVGADEEGGKDRRVGGDEVGEGMRPQVALIQPGGQGTRSRETVDSFHPSCPASLAASSATAAIAQADALLNQLRHMRLADRNCPSFPPSLPHSHPSPSSPWARHGKGLEAITFYPSSSPSSSLTFPSSSAKV
ncbi:hypothetical protein VYU27_008453 [Nannochloropsis oceanica]